MDGLRTTARTQWLGFWAVLIGAALGPAAFGADLITGTLNAGGDISRSANYTIKSSLGEIAGIASAAAPAIAIESGFISQISSWVIPVAAFSVTPTLIGESNSVTFTDFSTGPITNRFWTFDDGTTSNTLATTVPHTYNGVGVYTVALTVYGPAGYDQLTLSNAVTVWPKAATPSFLPASGNYTNTLPVTLSCVTPNATIYYTTDGSLPTPASSLTVTSGAVITLLNSATVKALAVATNTFPSPVATTRFTIIDPLPTAAPPTFVPNGGHFSGGGSVTILCATPGATLYYTTDGSPPSTNSAVYSGSITVMAATTTIHARASKTGFNPSAMATATFTVSQTGTLTIITPDSLPAATRGLTYPLTFAAVNGTGPTTWSLVAGQLPAGIKLNKTGALTGKPTAAGDAYFTVAVADAAAHTAEKDYHLAVDDPVDYFTSLLGTYTGLVIETNTPSYASSGLIQIVLSKTGAFAGSLTLGGSKTTFKGVFDLFTGSAAVISGKATLILNLDLSGASKQITGTVSHGINAAGNLATSTLVADLAGFGQSYAGTYALRFAPINDADATLPQGDGYATLTVNSAGSATLSGALADGTAIAAKAPVSQDGHWPFYVSLYGNTGSCISWISLSNQTATALVDWYGPTKKGTYTNFTTALDLFGAAPLTGAALANAQVVILSGGGLPSVFTNKISVDFTGKVIVSLPNAETLTLKITPKTGKFTGTFKLPAGGRAISFNGLLLQPATGNGFFLNSGHSGAVQIESTGP